MDPMMNLRALIQLAKVYQGLGQEAQVTLGAYRTQSQLPNLEARTPEDRAAAEKMEQWLQTAALEGVEEAGTLARQIRASLYPIRTGDASQPCLAGAGRPSYFR